MRCDRGNTFGRGCQNDREVRVERKFESGYSTISHECFEHGREVKNQPGLRGWSLGPLRRAA